MIQPVMYDTLSEQFCPLLKEDVLTIYVCGVTVYDQCHVGHGRIKVVFDVLRRWLDALGQPVRMVTNITDIDDKIIARAQALGTEWDVIAQRYIDAMLRDDLRLGLMSPDALPRATEYIPQMIALVQQLIDSGAAYIAEDHGVYFSVQHCAQYGALSKQTSEALREGEEGTKRDALDFALWKPAKVGEPSWEAPWGAGRPGWHLECSAMVHACLGHPIDWHGGGVDLKFPHHENECAQSESAWGAPMARHWMHVGLMDRDGVKMSKSLGNAISLEEALDEYGPEVLRLFYLKTHYRKPLSWSASALEEARARWTRYVRVCQPWVGQDLPCSDEVWQMFLDSLAHDFNTPQAITQMDAWAKAAAKEPASASMYAAVLFRALAVLGITVPQAVSDAWVEQLIEAREQARLARNFARADAIREQLIQEGIRLEDAPEGVHWYRV